METGDLIVWAIGIVVSVLAGVAARTGATIARNGRDLARMEGRVEAIERQQVVQGDELSRIHQRIGGVGTAVDRLCGQVSQLGQTLHTIHEYLLRRRRDEE